MIPVKGIVVCVDYDDYLAITLPRNARHLTNVLVVTSPEDVRTQAVVKSVPSARCFVTDAFTRGGKRFNKGAAMEEGFDAIGRDGWTLIHDADTLLPDSVTFDDLDPTMIYGAPRRLCDLQSPPHESAWKRFPISRETGLPGYFQLFHGSAIRNVRPWYDVNSNHAGIGDARFHGHWTTDRKKWLPMEVLHLGPRDVNWFGRASARLDGLPTKLTPTDAESLFRSSGWKR